MDIEQDTSQLLERSVHLIRQDNELLEQYRAQEQQN
jgi:hypothetical protein